jgi:hypothetical protein
MPSSRQVRNVVVFGKSSFRLNLREAVIDRQAKRPAPDPCALVPQVIRPQPHPPNANGDRHCCRSPLSSTAGFPCPSVFAPSVRLRRLPSGTRSPWAAWTTWLAPASSRAFARCRPACQPRCCSRSAFRLRPSWSTGLSAWDGRGSCVPRHRSCSTHAFWRFPADGHPLKDRFPGLLSRRPSDRLGSGLLVPRRADPGAAFRRPGDCSGSCLPCCLQPAWHSPSRAASSVNLRWDFKAFAAISRIVCSLPIDRGCASSPSRASRILQSYPQTAVCRWTTLRKPVIGRGFPRIWGS